MPGVRLVGSGPPLLYHCDRCPIEIFHPESPASFAARDLLLQRALRDEPQPFAIASEYPLVLAPAGARFSYCVGDSADIVAHANLWPRILVDSLSRRELPVGLVGNVATDERRRGQGLARNLMNELKREAERLGLGALVLWSDLLGFYQKLGFKSCGHERRYGFAAADLPAPAPGGIVEVAPEARSNLAQAMLTSRFTAACTLARSVSECQTLLQIPGLTALWAPAAAGRPAAYALIGKGADMVGVVHEWGAATPAQLLALVRAAADATGLGEILLLAPAALPKAWDEALTAAAEVTERHPMAHAWTRDATTAAALDRSFIWGLDSI